MPGEIPAVPQEGASKIHDAKVWRDRIVGQIDVDAYIRQYGIEQPQVQDVLRSLPTLVYSLGAVAEQPELVHNRLTGQAVQVRRLIEGSGMFGLGSKDDALYMRGIKNHIDGAARHKEYIYQKMQNMTDQQVHAFSERGYSVDSRFEMHPSFQVDVGLFDHAGRRSVDNEKWYGWPNVYAPGEDSAETTRALLINKVAPPELLVYMRFEDHRYLDNQYAEFGFLPNLADNASTVGDWTYNQEPVDLHERFEGLSASQRQSNPRLARLRECGERFVNDYNEIFDTNLTQELNAIPLRPWELAVRRAYCATNGLTLSEAFPTFVQQYPKALETS